jgi:hypothetical protein
MTNGQQQPAVAIKPPALTINGFPSSTLEDVECIARGIEDAVHHATAITLERESSRAM